MKTYTVTYTVSYYEHDYLLSDKIKADARFLFFWPLQI
jgi:hypothetical protein